MANYRQSVNNLGRYDVVRAASKLGAEAAALLVGSMRRMDDVVAAAELRVLAGGGLGAALEVGALGLGLAVRAAAMFLQMGQIRGS